MFPDICEKLSLLLRELQRRRPRDGRLFALFGLGISRFVQILSCAAAPDHNDRRLGVFLYALLNGSGKVVLSASVDEIPELVIDPDLLLLQGGL